MMIPLRVLLIEDSELDAGLILRQLLEAGYQVDFNRVEEADQLISALKEPWEIIFADYRLPNFSATEALTIVQDTGKDIPFIIVSGAIGEETAVSLMRSGARDYIMKDKLSRLPPVVARELVEARNRLSQKQALQALMDSEINLKHSQQLAHVAHWVANLETGQQSWSDEMYRIFGVDPRKIKGDMQAWLDVIHPDDRLKVLTFLETYEQKDIDKSIEYRAIRPDGNIRYILAQVGETRLDEHGKPVQRTGVIQDITELKLIELDLLEKMKESQKRARELETITLISSKMRQAANRQGLVKIVLAELAKILNADHATFSFLDGDSLSSDYAILQHKLVAVYQKNKMSEWFRAFLFGKVKGFIEIATPELIKEIPTWVYENATPPGSIIAYPVHVEEQVIGFLYFDFIKQQNFMQEQRNLVETVAEMAGNALKRMAAVDELESMVLLRERELESIYKVTSSASVTLDLPKALQQALELTLDAIHTQNGAVFLLDESAPGLSLIASHHDDRLTETLFTDATLQLHLGRVVEQHKALVVSNFIDGMDRNPEFQSLWSFIGFPMRAQDRVVGVLAVIYHSDEQVVLEEMTLLSFIADHLALVVENTRLYRTAERSAVLEERSRLARELHDSVTQSLYSANLYSAGVKRLFSQAKYSEASGYLTQIGDLTQQALKEMRLLVYELRSPVLERNGLIGAIQNRLDAVERRSNIEVEIKTDRIEPLPPNVEENLYRIAIESLNNSLKHSQATKITLELLRDEDGIVFSIQDNGIGFIKDEGLSSGGVGLATMHERAERIAATYEIQTSPQAGTKIEIRVPNQMK